MGLYHVHPCSSSCFLAPQQAFVGEMGRKRRLVAASSYVFEKGRNFSKQVGHWAPRSRPRAGKQASLSPGRGQQSKLSTVPAAGQQGKLHLIPAAGRETKALQLGRENNKICLSAMAERHIKKLQMIFLNK